MTESVHIDPNIPLSARIEAEQVRQLAAGARLAAILGPFWALMLSVLMHVGLFPEIGTASVTTVILMVATISAWSLATAGFVRSVRSHKCLEGEIRYWSRTAKLFLPTGAITWSCCLLYLWEPGNGVNHLFVATLFYATALAFLGCYTSHWRIYVSLQSLTMAILIGQSLVDALPLNGVIIILAMAFLITALYCGWLVHQHIADGLLLRFRNEGLVDELAAARDDALEQRKEAFTANRAKSAFLANMSHELRTPLNAVIGFSEIIKDQLLGPVGSPRYLEYAGDILTSGNHLLALINEILDLAKIEAGRIEIEPRRIEALAAVSEALRLTRVRADQKGHSIITAIAADCPDVFADARALTQILVNLISNAIKFTPEGGTITVSATSVGSFIEYTVSDTGPGISPEDLVRVFKPFEQADNRYAHSEGGTGLGLALVKGLVTLHGGTCTIESTLGRGTSVRVRLPLCEPAAKRAVA